MGYGLSGHDSWTLLNYRILNRRSTEESNSFELSIVDIAVRSYLCAIVFNRLDRILVDQRFLKKLIKSKAIH